MGMDDDQLGEFAYDYVEVRRDYLAWTRSSDDRRDKDEDIPMHERYGVGEHKDMARVQGRARPERQKGVAQSGGRKGEGCVAVSWTRICTLQRLH